VLLFFGFEPKSIKTISFSKPILNFCISGVYLQPMNDRKVTNILFDLGGVILDLDKQRCINSFNALGIPVDEDYLGLYGQKGLLGELEIGAISDKEFYHRFRKEFRCALTDEAIRDAWNAYLVGIPDERLALLRQLKQKSRLILLSNTSSIHTDFWEQMFVFEHDKTGSNYFFDAVYCSFRTGFVKPNDDAFLNVVDAEGINPQETLFFDDSLSNIEAARKLGFNTFYVNKETDLLHYDFDLLA
jgi:glucose-1-phosphatase